MRNGDNKMYKARKHEGCYPLISEWKLSPVLVGVFISFSIVQFSAGEIPFSPSEAVKLAQDTPSSTNDTFLPKSSTPPNCSQPKTIGGKLTVLCTSYTTLPTDIANPNELVGLDMSPGNTLQTLKNGDLLRSKLTALQNLNLQNCRVHQIEVDAFDMGAETPNILHLDLSHNRIATLDPKVFAKLVRLQTLNLAHNPIHAFERDAIFPPLVNLKSLDLSDCTLSAVPTDVFSNLKNLEKLSLSNNKFEHLDWRVFKQTPLKQLSLAGNYWNCDCRVKFLMEYLQNFTQVSNFHQFTCNKTGSLRSTNIGASWASVPKEEMKCDTIIDKLDYDFLQPSSQSKNITDDNDEVNVNVDDNIYFECQYSGHPKPEVIWLKDNKPVAINENSNKIRKTRQIPADDSSPNNIDDSKQPEIKNRIVIQDVPLELKEYEHDYNYHYKEHLVIYRVKAKDHGSYTCSVNGGGCANCEKTKTLIVAGSGDVVYGAGVDKVTPWKWILIAILCVLILILILLVTCVIWRRREKKKQEGFRKVVHEKFKDSNIDLGEFEIKTGSPNSEQSKNALCVDGATPLLDNRSESSTLRMSDNHQKIPPLPDVALGNANLIRNSQIFSPKPPPAHLVHPDSRKEFFARQISEPYLRPASAMSLSRPDALNASQRRYIFANQPYQSEPVYGQFENQYAVPSQVRDFPRSGSAMSISALPEYDLRRQMFLRQYSQPQSQYATASRLPPRRLPSTSSEPPMENNMRAVYNYSTLPRRPIRQQNWSRPVSPTNSTCSNYSTLSWRPNIDPRTGVMSDGIGARNTAHGGSSTSVNKIPDMNGSIVGIGDGSGLESMNRAMQTPSSGGGKIKTARTPRYGHSRTPSSLTRGHNDFFSFEPIQEVESSECASTLNLDRAGGRQTPTGYSTQSLARGEPRRRKKPPPITIIPSHLKTPSRAFDHLKGRSVSPALRNNIVNGDQPTEEKASAAAPTPENDSNSGVSTVQNSVVNGTNAASNSSTPVPMLESPIDEEVQPPSKSSSKAPPPPPPPKPKRHHQSQEEIQEEPTREGNDSNTATTADGTVV